MYIEYVNSELFDFIEVGRYSAKVILYNFDFLSILLGAVKMRTVASNENNVAHRKTCSLAGFQCTCLYINTAVMAIVN